jgi:branched-chain amino acid transport system substrate-binding protein
MSPVVVTSVPLSGPLAHAGRDAAAGAQLALDDAGSPAEHRVLDAGVGIDLAEANARDAAADPDVVAYLGDFHSSATEVSLPLLEAAGVPQVSFSNTFRALAGATYFNVMPDDERAVAGLTRWMAELGVERPFLLCDGDRYGDDMRWLVHRTWAASGRRVAGARSLFGETELPRDLGAPDAVFLGAVAEPATVSVLRNLAGQLPAAPVFAMDGLQDDALAAALPEEIAARVHVARGAMGTPELPPAGRAVMERIAAFLGHEPDVHAVYAYEAMTLAADALAAAGADRARVAAALRGTHERDSVLGRYSLGPTGATTLAATGRLRIRNGRFVPV